ncbi:MAG: hypothetical protein U1A53_23975 [Prosthecobacter sp.]|nr:hypothetical protein [Prosthecobacter sp.]
MRDQQPHRPRNTAPAYLIVLHGRQGFFAIHRRDVTVAEIAPLLQRIGLDIARVPCRTPEGCPAQIAELFDNAIPDPDANPDEYLLAFRTKEPDAQAVAAALRDAFPDPRIPLPSGAIETILRVAEFRFYNS